MSHKKSSSSRVQGSWAASVSHKPKNANTSVTKSHPNWAGKQTKQPDEVRHLFQEVRSEEIKQVPKSNVLRENGEHILGSTSNGTSLIRLQHDFVDKNNADWMFETLFNEIEWNVQRNHKYGTNEGRMTEWFSDYPYSYSGVTQQPNPHWHPLITALCDRLNEEYKLQFNSVLANCYRDGHDSVDWHTDSEPALGRNPPIASISFGDTRNFELREMPLSKDDTDVRNCLHYKVPLCHGTLLLMLGATQHDWQHRVPKEYHDRNPRINLTFRVMHPENRKR